MAEIGQRNARLVKLHLWNSRITSDNIFERRLQELQRSSSDHGDTRFLKKARR